MTAALKWQTAFVALLALGIAAFGEPAFGQVSSERAAAIHDCSTKAAKHKDYLDETEHIATYRTCMTNYRQSY
jgi:hypothetical protein